MRKGAMNAGDQQLKKKYKQTKTMHSSITYAPNIHQAGGILNRISSPWPFAQWELDIVEPFPKATGNQRWLLVRID